MQRKNRRSSNTLPMRPSMGRFSSGGGLGQQSRVEQSSRSIPPVPATPLARGGAGAVNTSRSVAFTPMGASSFAETPRVFNTMARTAVQGTAKKDTRPLTDKNYQREMVTKILDFLRDRNYSEAITGKDLMKLNMQQFCKLFNFLLGQLGFHQQVAERGNKEEEILNACRCLCYPGNITKQCLTSIGTLHTIPYILGLLSWIVSLSQAAEESCDLPQSKDPDNEGVFELQTLLYGKWLETGEIEEQAMAEFHRHRLNVDEARIRRLEAYSEECDKKLSGYSKITGKIQALREKQQSLETRQEMLKSDLQSLENQTASVKLEYNRILQENTEKRTKCDSSQTEIQRLKDFVRTQEISPEDAKRLQNELVEEKRKNDVLLEERNDLDEIMQKRELDLAELRAQEAKISREVRTQAVDIKLDIEECEAVGFEEMKKLKDSEAQDLWEQITAANEKLVLLRAEEKALASKTMALKTETGQCRENLETAVKEKEAAKMQLKSLEQKWEETEKELRKKLAASESAAQQKLRDLATAENELREAEKAGEAKKSAKLNELNKVKADYEEFCSKMKEEKKTVLTRHLKLIEGQMAIRTAVMNGTFSGNFMDYMDSSIADLIKKYSK